MAVRLGAGLPVVVVGGGWAGCAAAVELVTAGVPVHLLEAGSVLGGRARRLELTLAGVRRTLDNGQHLLMGAYGEFARLLRLVGPPLPQVVQRRPFELRMPDGFRLQHWPLPAPWHRAGALLSARGLAWLDRVRVARALLALEARGWRVEPDCTVDAWLRASGQSEATAARLWHPLTLAALNTAPDRASAQVLATVLRDTLGAGALASELWIPREDLSALFPERAAAYLRSYGSKVETGALVQRVQRSGDHWLIGVRAKGSLMPRPIAAAAVVYAAPPHLLARVAAAEAGALQPAIDAIARFEYEPISTVYLAYPDGVRLARGFSALLEDPAGGAMGQWVFDRGALDPLAAGVMAVVVSGRGPAAGLGADVLAEAVAAQLARAFGWPAPLEARTVTERRATLSAVPGLQRPPVATALPGLVLAGDWTASEYPSTLETAVRSGVAAARVLLQQARAGS